MNNLAKNEDAIYRNKDMLKFADFVKDKYFALKAIPKPKKEEKSKDEKEEKEK